MNLDNMTSEASGRGLVTDNPEVAPDDALLDDSMEVCPDATSGLADLMSSYGAAVKRGEADVNDPVWLEKFTQATSLQQSGEGSQPPVSSVVAEAVSRVPVETQERTTDSRIRDLEAAISSLRYAGIISEVQKRDLLIETRERDKSIRMGLFANKFVKHHAGDLFDQQTHMDDLTEAAMALAPELVQGYSAAALEGKLAETTLTVAGSCMLQSLSPLIKLLVGARQNLDRQVHYQQLCNSSKVGFEEMRNYLSQDEAMAKHFSGSTADKAAWVAFQKLAESEILKQRTHQKSLEKVQNESGASGSTTQGAGSKVPNPSAGGAGIAEKRAANKRARNARSRQRKKVARAAKKANPQPPADKKN